MIRVICTYCQPFNPNDGFIDYPGKVLNSPEGRMFLRLNGWKVKKTDAGYNFYMCPGCVSNLQRVTIWEKAK